MGIALVRSRSWIVATAATAAMLVLLTACGGSSSSSSSASSPANGSSTTQTSQTSQSAGQFKAALAPALNQFKSASQGTGAALEHAGSQTDSQLQATFKQLEAKWQAGVTKLEALQPPPELTAKYNRLKSLVTQVKSDLSAIVSAAQNHDASAAKAASTKLVNDIVAAKSSAATLSNGTA